MVIAIERTEGHYEVQELEVGRVYRWRPESVVVECECGERLSLAGSTTICECGLDHAEAVSEELDAGGLDDEALHPWRYVGDREDVGIPF